MKLTLLESALVVCGITAGSLAGIPEPDAILYGTVTINGTVQAALDDVTIIARIDGVPDPIGQYHMGDNSSAGDRYVLRMRLESLADGSTQSDNTALVGQTARIYAQQEDDPEQHVTDFVITEPGLVRELNLGPCGIASVFPPNCALDARQPSMPDGSNPGGWNSIEITFSAESCVSGATSSDFNVTITPAGTAPTIADVVVVGSAATLVFNGIIPTRAWTCIEHTGCGASTCIGSLPGDVSGDHTSAPSDILRVIDCLNGVAFCESWQCDVDRSGVCGPPDILRVIDLLNGAGVYDSWLNIQLPACPSAD